ncbi:import inner membrane translocase subunit tim-21, mitochondrial [Zopfia rhizophila CBS 207.26]|uniref:Mitochondrial import inner membrane translocase subunit Tim21 n=1 Tax=Zopfia rhizophila CBS 207.26 TaxID=1314779 RepID=A0A6A6DLX7_9PEZI|nr:import inner membrane translocase subunit tim-21, mitochondrial [Zopfia rhizophila CBS 207.26]
MTAIYRPTEAIHFFKPCLRRIPMRPSNGASRFAFSTSRTLKATSPSSTSNRKHVTVVNDDGRVRWSELSVGEKAARTTQQSFNFAIVVVGVVMTGAVSYLLYKEVFSTDSKTAHFNRVTDQIRGDPRCTKLLGDSSKIKSYGEPSWSRWARNRFIASTTETDRWGTEHLRMKFYVEGPLNQGVVHVHMTKRPSQDEYVYQTLAVDVKGHSRIYLENADEEVGKKAAPKIFGARWW